MQIRTDGVRASFSRWRQSYGYDMGIRTIGAAWFLVLATMVICPIQAGLGDQLGDPGEHFLRIASQVGLAMYYLTLWLLLIIRPMPFASAEGWLPRLAAFVGTYMPCVIVLFPPADLSPVGNAAAAVLILIGNALTLVVVWHLGHAFSFVPQARRFVRNGPYAVIRHPLYLAEEIMVAGTTALYFSPVTLALLALHVVIQLRRMTYEEALLTRSFPDYAAYASRTARLVPGVW